MGFPAENGSAMGGLLRVPTKSHPGDTRRANRSLLLQMLFTRGPMSRAQLARVSGLARPSVSKVISQLEDEGLVVELDALAPGVPGKAGKKGTLVGIRESDLQIIAIDLSAEERIIGTRTNLRGQVLEHRELAFGGAVGEQAVLLVLSLIDQLRSGASELMGIGIAAPGIVDDAGVVRMSVRLKWYDVALADRVATETGVATYVGNDSQSVALGQHAFSPNESPRRSLMAVTIEQGAGAGFILDGRQVRGSQYAAGEFGHVTVDLNGSLCECGRIGCLDAEVSAVKLRARLDAAESASRGEILHAAGTSLGLILAPIVSALDLDEVVVCGPPDLVEGTFLRAVFATVRGRNLAAVSHSISMTYGGSGHELALMGATALVLSRTLGVA